MPANGGTARTFMVKAGTAEYLMTLTTQQLQTVAPRLDYALHAITRHTASQGATPLSLVQTMKAANPSLKMLGYAGTFDSGSVVGEGLVDDASACARLRSSPASGSHPLMDYGSQFRALFDPGEQGTTSYHKFVARCVLDALTAYLLPNGSLGLDGVFLDNAWLTMKNTPLFTLDGQGNPVAKWSSAEGGNDQLYRPWNPRTNDYYSAADWATDVRESVRYVAQTVHGAYPSALVFYNGVQWFVDGSPAGGVAGGNPGAPDQASLLDFCDGADMESFVHALWDLPQNYFDSWAWSVAKLSAMSRLGKTILVTSGVDSTDLATQQQINDYTFASYLLGMEASANTAYMFWPWDLYDPAQTPWPGFAADLGSPSSTPYTVAPSGLAQRTFAKGQVLVNPTGAPIVVGQGQLNVAGTWDSYPTLAARTGLVLRN
jgi:hypothetical protein